MKLIFFGASHAFFMARAAGRFHGDWDDVIDGPLPITADDGAEVGHLVLASPRARLFEAARVDGHIVPCIAPHYASRLAALDVADNRAFFLLGGNEHNTLFMRRHAVPFDFRDELGDAPLLPGRQVVPVEVVRDHLRAGLAQTLPHLQLALASLARTRRSIVAPPPPIPSADHIHGLPEAFDFTARPLEDRWVRLKVWRLYVDLLAESCAALGLPLLGAPPHTVDDDGFLAPAFWNYATHAQPAYYAPLIASE